MIAREVEKVSLLHHHTFVVLAVTAGVYAVVEGVESVGLWRQRRWAEYLTAVATAGFLPFEIYELTERVTVLRVLALVVNLAVLAWLVWRKRLFGIGRGRFTGVAVTAGTDEDLFATDETWDLP